MFLVERRQRSQQIPPDADAGPNRVHVNVLSRGSIWDATYFDADVAQKRGHVRV
jgi:hypothetical protein